MIRQLTLLCITVLLLTAAAAVCGCSTGGNGGGAGDTGSVANGTGVLKGIVTVAPWVVSPRESILPPPPDPSVFTSRVLLLYDENGTTLLQEIPVQPPKAGGYQGSYEVTLKAGNYTLGYNYSDTVRFTPAVIPVVAGQALDVDVYIENATQ